MLMGKFDPMVLQDAHTSFDIKSAKRKQFYKLLFESKKAKLPNMSNRLITDFDVEDTCTCMLDKMYLLPDNHISSRPEVKVCHLWHPNASRAQLCMVWLKT